MKRKAKWVRAVVGTAIGLAIAVFLFLQINPQDFEKITGRFSWSWIIASFSMYSLSTLLRAYRWKHMLVSKKVSLFSFFCVTSIHNLLNHLLPARTGELSYVILLKKTQSVPSSQGVATLLLARVIDLVTMGFFFLVAILLFWHKVTVPSLGLFVATFFAIALLLVIFLGIFSRKGVQLIRQVFSFLGLLKWKMFLKGSDFLVQLGHDLYQIKKSGRLLKYAALTFLVWATKFVAFYTIIRTLVFSEPVTLWETVLGTTFSELASTLPIYGFAGLGTVEGGWTLGFMLLGFDQQSIILSAFYFHFMILTFASILGVFGFFSLKTSSSSKVHQPSGAHPI